MRAGLSATPPMNVSLIDESGQIRTAHGELGGQQSFEIVPVAGAFLRHEVFVERSQSVVRT